VFEERTARESQIGFGINREDFDLLHGENHRASENVLAIEFAANHEQITKLCVTVRVVIIS
jgi:hypothetical protein